MPDTPEMPVPETASADRYRPVVWALRGFRTILTFPQTKP